MSRVEFIRFPFEREGYPKPRLDALPRMDPSGLARMLVGRNREAWFDGCELFVRARYAQFHAQARAAVESGDGVLVPAYHCRTMVEPVIRAGAEPLLYRVHSDLRPDLEHIDSILSGQRGRVPCMLLPHYFGFRQPMSELLPLLDHHGVTLIEDCAHVMKPGPAPDGSGRQGEFAIFCPAKFLPCPDGGVLCGAANAPGGPRPRRGFGDELRFFGRLLEAALRWPRHARGAVQPVPDARRANDDGRRNADRRSIDTGEILDGQTRTYSPSNEDIRCSVWSSRILNTADADAVAQARRRHFRRWLSETETLSGCTPLFDELDEDTVPYMFPLVLQRGEQQFDALKRLGMPMYRWDEIALSDCRNAGQYRLSLVHLPCHQDLDATAMEQLAGMLRTGIGTSDQRQTTA